MLAVNQAWLDPVFSANTQPHIFVMNHYPAYSVVHPDCLDDNIPERDAFWNSMGAAGCRIYLCGHDHLYNHARAQDASGNWIHQYVIGTGGAPFHTWGGTYVEPSVQGISYLQNNGYCVVDITGAQVTLTFKQRGNSPAFTPYAVADTYTYISPLAKVTAIFDASPTTGTTPATITFTDASTSNVEDITGWQWDFGDGITATEQKPSHTYTAAGDYSVTLTVMTAHMQAYKTQTGYIHIAGATKVPAGSTTALMILAFALAFIGAWIVRVWAAA
jgi:hypothetical protein